MKTFAEFANDLSKRESSNDYQARNSWGFMGRWQFGKARLWDLGISIEGFIPKNISRQFHGLSIDEICKRYDRQIITEDLFLGNPEIQNKVFADHVRDAIRQINHFGYNSYMGQTINNILITLSGMVAGFHLKGIGNNMKDKDGNWKHPGLKHFLVHGYDNTDGLGTKISEYISKFGGYNLTNINYRDIK